MIIVLEYSIDYGRSNEIISYYFHFKAMLMFHLSLEAAHMTPNLRDCLMTEQKKPPNKRVVAFKQCQDDQDMPHLNLFHFLPI